MEAVLNLPPDTRPLIDKQIALLENTIFERFEEEESYFAMYAAGFLQAITLLKAAGGGHALPTKPAPTTRARQLSASSGAVGSSSSPHQGPSSDAVAASSPASSILSLGPNKLLDEHWTFITENISHDPKHPVPYQPPQTADHDAVLVWLDEATRLRAFEMRCHGCGLPAALDDLNCTVCTQSSLNAILHLQDDLADARDELADREAELAAVQDDCDDWRAKAFKAEVRAREFERDAEAAEERANMWCGDLEDADAENERLTEEVSRLEEELADATADQQGDSYGMRDWTGEEEGTAIETEEEPTEVEDDDSAAGSFAFHYDALVAGRPNKRARRAPPPADPNLSKEPLIPRRLFSSLLPPNAHADHRRAPLGRAPLREVAGPVTAAPPFWLHARKTHSALDREPSEAGTEGSDEVAEIRVWSEEDEEGDSDEAEDEVDYAYPDVLPDVRGKGRVVAEAKKPGRGYNKRVADEQPKKGLKRGVAGRR